MAHTIKPGFNFRVAALLLFVFLTPIAQAAEFISNSALENEALDRLLRDEIRSNLVLTPDTSYIQIFEVPLIGRITGFGIRQGNVDGGQFNDLDQQAVYVDFRLPWRWSAWGSTTITPRLTLEVGRFVNDVEDRAFGSLGPNFLFENERWRLPLVVDMGLSPTVIDGSTYGDRELGTSFNFTSHLAVGMRFGQSHDHRVSLRYQHISNGGISAKNPGVNMIGLDVVLWSRQ